MATEIINELNTSEQYQISDQQSPSSLYEVSLLLCSVMVAYCVLYGPQVIVSNWIQRYGFSPQRASYIVYISLIPMSIAPLSYGYLIGKRETSRLISSSLFLLGVVTLSLAWMTDSRMMLIARFIQGCLLPVIMTAVMSRLSAQGDHRGRQLITYYLCSTVIGGLFGRLVMGHITDMYDDHTAWVIWGGSLLILSILLVIHRSPMIAYNAHKSSLSQLEKALNLPTVIPTLLCGAMMFGVFSAALNLLPLRALELNLGGGSSAVSYRYGGYLIGAIISLSARSIDQALGGRGRAPALGMIVMSIGLYWGSVETVYAPLSGMVLLLCAGLFMTHPLLAAHITQISPQERGLMSGLYVSSYYLGGALCSSLFSGCYERYGWTISLGLLALFSLLGALFAALSLKSIRGSLRVEVRG